MIIFFDTNILLDVLLRRKPYDAAALQLWFLAETDAVDSAVAAISFNNVYYVARQVADRNKAIESVRLIRGVFEIIPVDERILDQAMNSKISDFEDAIQYFCAVRAGADYLVTRNISDFPKRGMPIVSPEEMLALLAANPSS